MPLFSCKNLKTDKNRFCLCNILTIGSVPTIITGFVKKCIRTFGEEEYDYGKRYAFWQILDIVLIFLCFRCNLILKVKELTNGMIIEIFLLKY